MATVYEHNEDTPLGPDDVDGMAKEIADDEAAGWEGEHVFDASIEDPPHPYWDPVTKKIIPSED